MPAWVRAHLDDACLLLLYHRRDFTQGPWPQALKQGVADQARRFEACVTQFAREALRGTNPNRLRTAQFVLVDVPGGAVRPHLARHEPPPRVVERLIRQTYHAIVD
jgi:hypothetical protein